MIKKNWPFILLVILNIVLISYIIISKQFFNHKNGLNDNLTNFENNQILHYMFEDEKVNPLTKLTTPDLDSICFIDLLSHKPKLCFVYSNISCKPCIDNVISELNKISNNMNPNDILLITDYVNLRDLILFAKVNKIKFKIYSINSLTQKGNLIKTVPYLTVLDNDYITKSVYIPISGETKLLNKYLEIVVDRINMFN